MEDGTPMRVVPVSMAAWGELCDVVRNGDYR
jgi:hypothetical protein